MTSTPARRVVAYVPDLMDRSRLGDGVELVTSPAALAGVDADLVVVDLGRPGVLEAVAGLGARVVGFAPHVDDDLLAASRAAGIEALPRSVFFRRYPDL